MARMTATDMVAQVRAALGGESSNVISDVVILRFLNCNATDISSIYRPSELITTFTFNTTSGTAVYNVVSTYPLLFPIRMVDSTSGVYLLEINRNEYDKMILGDITRATGNPTLWCLTGTSSDVPQCALYPTPDATYAMCFDYYMAPREIVLTPTATGWQFPEPWDSVIVDMATADGWKYLGDLDKASAFMKFAEDGAISASRTTIHASQLRNTLSSDVGRSL